MTLAIDITDEHGFSNRTCHEFMPKKSNCISRSFHGTRHLTSCSLSTRQSASVLKVGIPYRFERRLAYSVTIRILAQNQVLLLKYWGINRKIKFVCIAMCSLVMSLCSYDLLIMSFNTIYYITTLNNSRLTVV